MRVRCSMLRSGKSRLSHFQGRAGQSQLQGLCGGQAQRFSMLRRPLIIAAAQREEAQTVGKLQKLEIKVGLRLARNNCIFGSGLDVDTASAWPRHRRTPRPSLSLCCDLFCLDWALALCSSRLTSR